MPKLVRTNNSRVGQSALSVRTNVYDSVYEPLYDFKYDLHTNRIGSRFFIPLSTYLKNRSQIILCAPPGIVLKIGRVDDPLLVEK
jgi:hypothetical protein